jgi:FtsP/CotA-like multicopper oxidase with cupredoxin domain
MRWRKTTAASRIILIGAAALLMFPAMLLTQRGSRSPAAAPEAIRSDRPAGDLHAEAPPPHIDGLGTSGEVSRDAIGIDPILYLTTFNFSNVPSDQRGKFYRETPLGGRRLLREYWIYAIDREIEVAPGVHFPAWTFNGQVPGPTIRATEGDRIRIHFLNGGTRPHTMHFHGFHPAEMDGSMPSQFVEPGGEFTYEFEAEPFGLHLYHCHSTPLTEHIHKGLYGVFIVDPKVPREKAREFVMMMNGFDTDFDGENDVYAVNTVTFYYMTHPIEAELNELVRIYLVNILEFDQINSFHLHANFFEEYQTGTSRTPSAFTDIVTMGQAERSVLEFRFRHPGMYMFHAHKTEFSELGWMGMFKVNASAGGGRPE